MNYSNEQIFELYRSIIGVNARTNKAVNINKIKKLFRYIISGYFFHHKYYIKKLDEWNQFEAVKKTYDDIKLVIYTVNSGKYDTIKNPIYYDKRIAYYIFTDQELPNNCVWQRIKISDLALGNLSSLEQARYIKTHPHEFFEEYDYSMFIDANIRITCDIKPLVYSMIYNEKNIAIHQHQSRDCLYEEAKVIYAQGRAKLSDILEQTSCYKKSGFPKHYGLFETNILIRRHNDLTCKQIMNNWWEEIQKHTKRDQLSFTYTLWKNNIHSSYVYSLGNNSRKNPYFIVSSHN